LALTKREGAGGDESFKVNIYFNGDNHTESIYVYVDDSYVGGKASGARASGVERKTL
jgi:hypothetical protein